MAEVLLVSKPLCPPWTDGAKNLVRDLVTHSPGPHRFVCMVARGQSAPGSHRAAAIYRSAGGYAPGLRQNLRVLARLARPDRLPLYHFFFAPNPKTSYAAGAILRAKRKTSVHTVVSRPHGSPPLFADIHIALSEHTAAHLRALGGQDVRVVPPGLAPLEERPSAAARAATRRRYGLPSELPLVLFAGDLISGGGAEVIAEAARQSKRFHLVMACRPKGHGHRQTEVRLLRPLGSRATWLGTVDDMPSLAASVDVNCLPARDLLGKMDLPMVLLESMRAGVPTVTSNIPPLDELGVTMAEPTAESVAWTLEQVLSAPQPHGDLAFQTFSKRFNVLGMAEQYQAIYEELLS